MTNTFFTPNPATSARWRSVQAALKAAHDDTREAVNARIEKRKADSIPLDNNLDWQAATVRTINEAITIISTKGDSGRDDARKAVEKAHALLSDALVEIGEYKPDPALDGLEVKLRALTKGEVAKMRARLSETPDTDGESEANVWRAVATRNDVLRPFISRALAGVRFEAEDGRVEWESPTDEMPVELLDAIDSSGFLLAVFIVARDFQALSPLQRRGFGLPHP